MPSVHCCARIHIRIASASIHYLPLRPVVCMLGVAGAGGASCTTRRRARAARVAGARDAVGVRGGTFRLRFLAVRSCIGSSVVGSVCVFLSARLRRRVAPLCSYHCLFVGLVLACAWCVINRQRRESIALLFLLVLSLTAWLSPRHPVQRRPAIVLVPFGTSPDHGALIFLFVKERAADCARAAPCGFGFRCSGGAEGINRIFPMAPIH